MSAPHAERIAVLMGGVSRERDISLESGQAVVDALRGLGLEVLPVDVREDFERSFPGQRDRVDVAFIALHGCYGEDGQVQAYLDGLGMPYTGSGVEASRLAIDKPASKEVFLREGIPTAPFVRLARDERPGRIPFGFPVVVKPAREGSTIGVTIVRSEEGLDGALEEAFGCGDCAIIEQFIEGDDVTAAVLGGEGLPLVRVLTARDFYDYEAKYHDAATRYEVPALLAPELAASISDAALRSYRALGCRGLARVDTIAGRSGGCQVLEVNTVPGLTAHSLAPMAARAAGIQFPELCARMIRDALPGGAGRRGRGSVRNSV